MNMKTFILIVALKLIAIQIMAIGIYTELRCNASISTIFITVGSLIFAIASNTTLFCVVYNYDRNEKRRRHNEDNNDEDFNKCTSFDSI